MSAVNNIENEENKPRRGNPNWAAGMKSANPEGRPKVIDKDKKSNKTRRSESFLELVRKFRPHLSKAVMTAVNIMGDDKSSESGKLRASALIIQTYRELVKDLYDAKYDDEEAEAIQETDNRPVFSLKVIGNDSVEESKE